MTLSERALSFAIRAHDGQYRKSEPDKPYIIHPLTVGLILKKYGYDDTLVAAGYLHDVVEQTEFTIDDIARLFGGEVASLVMTATEADQSLSWKERKTAQIKVIANLPEKNAALVCADKIANIEDFRMEKRKNGEVDYSKYKVGIEEQKWFFTEVYKELSKIIKNPIVDRLSSSISDVFDNNTFDSYKFDFASSRILGYQEDLMKLRTIVGESKPYIIEFSGTPKSGKSSMITLFKDFFENAEFRVRVCEEKPAYKRYEKVFLRNKASISTVEKNLLISSAIEQDLMEQIVGKKDIVMVENGLFDSLVYIKILLNRGQITEEDFNYFVNYYLNEINSLINHVVISYTSYDAVRDRIINSSLSSNDSIDIYPVSEYNDALSNFESLISSASMVDTTKLMPKESSLIVADTLFPIMRKEYIIKLKKYLDQKKES